MSDDSTKPRSAFARALRRVATRAPGLAGQERSAQDWDREYAAGRWDYLEGPSELARHSVIVGYADHLKVAGAVLDVGCGTGALFPKLRTMGCRRYVGVDLSSKAIDTARERHGGEQVEFVARDAQEFEPQGRFDCVVFNEVLYFFRDPVATVARYARALRPDGLVLISTCTAFRGGEAMLAEVVAHHSVVDEVRVTSRGNDWSWIVSVLRPSPGRGSGGTG